MVKRGVTQVTAPELKKVALTEPTPSKMHCMEGEYRKAEPVKVTIVPPVLDPIDGETLAIFGSVKT
jgi:hypothetical protein